MKNTGAGTALWEAYNRPGALPVSNGWSTDEEGNVVRPQWRSQARLALPPAPAPRRAASRENLALFPRPVAPSSERARVRYGALQGIVMENNVDVMNGSLDSLRESLADVYADPNSKLRRAAGLRERQGGEVGTVEEGEEEQDAGQGEEEGRAGGAAGASLWLRKKTPEGSAAEEDGAAEWEPDVAPARAEPLASIDAILRSSAAARAPVAGAGGAAADVLPSLDAIARSSQATSASASAAAGEPSSLETAAAQRWEEAAGLAAAHVSAARRWAQAAAAAEELRKPPPPPKPRRRLVLPAKGDDGGAAAPAPAPAVRAPGAARVRTSAAVASGAEAASSPSAPPRRGTVSGGGSRAAPGRRRRSALGAPTAEGDLSGQQDGQEGQQ